MRLSLWQESLSIEKVIYQDMERHFNSVNGSYGAERPWPGDQEDAG